MHNDHGEVGHAGGEGLVPASCGGDPHDGSHNEGVGEEDKEKGDQHHEEAQEKNGQSFARTFGTTELQDRGNVAEEVLHTVAAAKGRGEDHARLNQSHGEPRAENQGSQAKANWRSHDHGVMQRAADSYIAVVTHQGQEEAVAATQAQEEEHLSPTACNGDSLALHEQMS